MRVKLVASRIHWHWYQRLLFIDIFIYLLWVVYGVQRFTNWWQHMWKHSRGFPHLRRPTEHDNRVCCLFYSYFWKIFNLFAFTRDIIAPNCPLSPPSECFVKWLFQTILPRKRIDLFDDRSTTAWSMRPISKRPTSNPDLWDTDKIKTMN